MNTVPVRRWTLQHRNDVPIDTQSTNCTIDWLTEVSVDEYLTLYNGVGSKWNWCDRLLMPRSDLRQLLASSDCSVGVFRGAGRQTIGFTEIRRHSRVEVEICYFGLLPDFLGKGFGRQLFSKVVASVKRQAEPGARIWLTTCEWDSPAALPFYQRMGFEIVGEDVMQKVLPATDESTKPAP